MKRLILFLLFLFLFSPQKTLAQVIINETSTFGSDDWIELYNTSEKEILLDNYILRDSTKNNKATIKGNIGARGFFVVPFGNKLNKDGDTIKLIEIKSGSEEIIQEIKYGKKEDICVPGDGETIGRFPDQSGEWHLFTVGTKGESNKNSGVRCSPGKAEEKKDIKEVELEKTPSPEPLIKDNPEPSVVPVLAAVSESSIPSPSSTPTVGQKLEATNLPLASVNNDKNKYLSRVLIVLGVTVCLISITFFARLIKDSYTDKVYGERKG